MKYDLLFKLIDKVDFYWNSLYITTGTIWAFLFIHTNLHLAHKLVFTVCYIALMAFNVRAHLRAYSFLNALVEELDEDVKADFKSDRLHTLYGTLSYNQQRMTCGIVYIALTCITVTLIWIDYVW
jgi:hypothetical protein